MQRSDYMICTKISFLKTCALLTAALLSMMLFTSCNDGNFNVVLVLDYRGSTEDSFNVPAIEGLASAKEFFGVTGDIIKAKTEEEFKNAFTKQSEGNDMIIAIGYKAEENIIDAAQLYPETNFIAIDVSFEGKTVPKNLVGISYRSQESSFLVGYIAGMMTETQKVGFIGGIEGLVDPFEYGFRAGVDFAAKQRNDEIEVIVYYVDDFYDQQAAEKLAIKQYSERCDIIFQAAGAAGIGVINAAQKTQCYCIGVDVDQSPLAPDYVLTSALKDIKYTVMSSIDDYKSGSAYMGGTKSLGLKEAGVGLPAENPLVPQEVLSRVEELKELIITEQLIPPENEEELEAFLSVS